MSKTGFTKHTRHHPSAHFWKWRHSNRSQHNASLEDANQAAEFAERAVNLRDEVERYLAGGLNEGAREVLATLAEEDRADFSILVDLGEPIELPGVPPLSGHVQAALAEFLGEEPWLSLAIDQDVTVAIAVLHQAGIEQTNRPWFEQFPHLIGFIARVLNSVNAEQLHRFVGEYNALAARDDLHLNPELEALADPLVAQACRRLRIAKIALAD